MRCDLQRGWSRPVDYEDVGAVPRSKGSGSECVPVAAESQPVVEASVVPPLRRADSGGKAQRVLLRAEWGVTSASATTPRPGHRIVDAESAPH